MIKDLQKIILSYLYQFGELLLDIPDFKDIQECQKCYQTLFILWNKLGKNGLIKKRSSTNGELVCFWMLDDNVYFYINDNYFKDIIFCKTSLSVYLDLLTHGLQKSYHNLDYTRPNNGIIYGMIKNVFKCDYDKLEMSNQEILNHVNSQKIEFKENILLIK